jgi:hypothetical protein
MRTHAHVCVQVCIEELKKLSRDEGVKALPYAQIYRPGQGKLVGLDIPPSKVRLVAAGVERPGPCRDRPTGASWCTLPVLWVWRAFVLAVVHV